MGTCLGKKAETKPEDRLWSKKKKKNEKTVMPQTVFHQSQAHTQAVSCAGITEHTHTHTHSEWQMAALSTPAGLLAQFGGRGRDLCCR